MHFSTLFGLAASIAYAEAVCQGFNYGNTMTDGTPKVQSDFEAEFKRAQNLQGTSGFTSARIYTMIQGGTTNTPIEAIPAAISTKTRLLLGLWASAGQDEFNNEVDALTAAIKQYGSSFTSLIDGISVGSEDLYRVSPTGIENDSGAGATPDELVSYIKQVRSAIQGTSASGASIGHVDTWTAYANSSNDAVISAIDWLGMDTYPYFENTQANSIDNGKSLFWAAYDATNAAAQGKEIWITETGWPVSGKTENDAIPSTQNAETYWQEVACVLLGKYNTWWYTLQDAEPSTPNPSFGIVGSDLSSAPLYNLSCKNTTNSTSSSSTLGTSTKTGSGAGSTGTGGAGYGHGGSSATGSSSASPTGGYGGSGSSNSTVPSGGAAPSGSSGASASAGAGTASVSGPASTASGAPLQSATGNSASKAAVPAGILAIFGLVAFL